MEYKNSFISIKANYVTKNKPNNNYKSSNLTNNNNNNNNNKP